HSSFSEEDLTSDLIGFYRAAWEARSGLSREDGYNRARELCKAVGMYDDEQTRLQKQRDIFFRYVSRNSHFYGTRGLGGFKDVHDWGRPRLIDIDSGYCPEYCPDANRRFPSEFQEFIPIRGGTWAWVSGRAELHGLGRNWYHEYSIHDLNR
ncbi:MAG: hypothetical protein ACREBU_19735, partial [Nitrososphaera sp.]